MSIIIARSTPNCSNSGGSLPTTTLCLPLVNVQKYVEPNSTVILDTFQTSRALAMKWYVVASTASGSKDRAFELVATELNGTVSSCLYSILGDKMDIDITVDYVLGSYQLSCTSIESEGVIIYLVRAFVPPGAVSTSISNTVTVDHLSTIVNGLSTTVIDTVRKERHQAVKWHITITTADGKEYTSQVFSLPAVGTGNNYGYIGTENKQLKLNIVDDTQNVNLILTNQTATDARVVITRMPITPELPQQCDVRSDVMPWIPPQASVPANSVTVVDEQMPIPGHAAVRWIVVAQQATTKRVFEVTANRNGLTASSFVQYGMIGDRVDINADVSLVGMSFVLTIHNSTSDAATINIIRVPMAV